MGAKTRADLNGLFDDLPESGMPGQGLPETGAPAGVCAQRRRFRHPVLLAAFVILVALAAGHVIFPLLWIGFLVVIALAVTGHFGRDRSQHHHDHQ
jgi:anti-sigma factor RsiW